MYIKQRCIFRMLNTRNRCKFGFLLKRKSLFRSLIIFWQKWFSLSSITFYWQIFTAVRRTLQPVHFSLVIVRIVPQAQFLWHFMVRGIGSTSGYVQGFHITQVAGPLTNLLGNDSHTEGRQHWGLIDQVWTWAPQNSVSSKKAGCHGRNERLVWPGTDLGLPTKVVSSASLVSSTKVE